MIRKKLVTFLTALSFCLYYMDINGTDIIQAKNLKEERKYIVCTKNGSELKEVEKEFGKTEEINENGGNCLQKKRMTTVELTESEAEDLADASEVSFVEEDICVKASSRFAWKDKNVHKKKVKRIKKNQSGTEWNIRMIHAGKAKKDEKKKIKIAILDSGVSYTDDIDMDPSKTISLVPGEEELSPLFMDGTGHGNSVAGLIAATDNKKGITGINPNVEIYSIRVLDDNNISPVSRVIEGIYMAIEEEVNIINMSFGMDTYSAALEKAVKDAKKAGILIVAAAGNTGGKGVEYPAAFDEVMAVGSVDQHGTAAESSAAGNEVEIVAPGELVRSSGIFCDELVSSGTSLAAPQVAAAASRIWEKDPSVSADFVRELLNQSANSYGDREKYGNGLLDLEYALESYDEFKEAYQERETDLSSAEGQTEMVLQENKRDVLSFDETGCVAGSWTFEFHEKMIPTNRVNVVKGAKYPDTNRETEGMYDNPWWHGFFHKNYVAAYIYETRLANQFTDDRGVTVPANMQWMRLAIEDAVKNINWKGQFGSTPSKGTKRAFVWGMAIHNLQDTFAHSTYEYKNGKWIPINHDKGNVDNDCDHTIRCETRYTLAVKAVKAAIRKYENSSHPSGSYAEYSSVLEAREFRMGDIYENIKKVAGSSFAAPYASVNYSTGFAASTK